MSDAPDALSAEERAELEELRREKAEREQAQTAARERAELEQLKAERERYETERATDEHIAAVREQGRKMMEPDEDDEDIRMPLGQKIVLAAIFILAAALLLATILGS